MRYRAALGVLASLRWATTLRLGEVFRLRCETILQAVIPHRGTTMATMNILTPEELAARDRHPGLNESGRGRKRSPERSRMIEGYRELLAQATPGYGVDVLLSEDEDKGLVRRQLKAAASDLGMALEFHRIKTKNRMHIRIITLEEKAAKPYYGGRPKKGQLEEAAPSK